MLPLNPKALVALLDEACHEVLIDRMNYSNKVKAIYRRADWSPTWRRITFVSSAWN